jgi:hypothetical protein
MADADLNSSLHPTMSVGSQLCTQCGLCCTGAIHDTVRAEPEEIEELRNHGMQVITGEKLAFSLPCPHLRGTSCGIYRDRPHACANYRCQLLRGVEAGTVDPADALRLYETVLRLLPPGMSLPQARALPRDIQQAPKTMDAAIYPVLVLQVLALMRYIDQYFRHSDEGPLLREEALTMGQTRQPSQKVPRQHV